MKTGREFKVRSLSDFSEIQTADDWLSVYSKTATVGELLGLLHEGGAYAHDGRVLEVYISYAKRQDGPLVVLQKAQSMFYHNILKQLTDHVGFGEFTFSNIAYKGNFPDPEKLLEFFIVPDVFPVQQPFQNDVYEFINWYGKALKAVPRKGTFENHWEKFMCVLAASLESQDGERYDKLTREILNKGGEPARKCFEPVLANRLSMAIRERKVDRDVAISSKEQLCEIGIKIGGVARLEALLLSDIIGYGRNEHFGNFIKL